MKFLLSVFFMLALFGCRPDIEIEPQFLPMIDLYLAHAPTRGRLGELREMRTGPLTLPQVGRTMIQDNAVGGVKFNGYTSIVIAPETNRCAWNRAVLHELGHAIHGFGHSSNPDSIMFDGWTVSDEKTDSDWCNDLGEKLDRMFQSGGHE